MCIKGSIESIVIEYGSVACRGLWCVCGWKDAEMALCKQFVLFFSQTGTSICTLLQ